MRKVAIAAFAAISLTSVANAASPMSAEEFHRRAHKLMGKGPLALFSAGEIKRLMGEVDRAGKQSRANRLADIAAHRQPRSCPPEKSNMDNKEFMRRLDAIPATDRAKIGMVEAMTRISAARFPCPQPR